MLKKLIACGLLGVLFFCHHHEQVIKAQQPSPTPTVVPGTISILNHSFESGSYTGSWEAAPGMDQANTVVVDGTQFPAASDGRYYAKVTRGTGDAYLNSQWIERGANVSGKSYRLTLDIKAHTTSASVSGILVQRFPKDGTDWSQTGAYLGPIQATNSWQTITQVVSLPTPTNGSATTQIRIVLRGNNEAFSQPIYYDNVRLQEIPDSSLACGQTCSNNTQCADGLSCYQPMTFNGNHWSDVTSNLSSLGDQPLTGWDVTYLSDSTPIQHAVKNGIVFFRSGSLHPNAPWTALDFSCQPEDTEASCCEKTGACGQSTQADPNDTLLGINFFQTNETDILIHLTRQKTGIYSKTIKRSELATTYPSVLRQRDGWQLQTQVAGLHALDGDYYASFTQGKDALGNTVQHLVKYDTNEPYTTHVYKHYGWLNRGWSHWMKIGTTTNQSTDLDYELGNQSTSGAVLSLDPLFATNTHHNYLIRGTISVTNSVYSLTDTKLYWYNPSQVTYTAGQCKHVFTPTNACTSDLAQPSNLSVTFRCTDGTAALSWNKSSTTGTPPNYYEIAICSSGACTTDAQWEAHLIPKVGYNAAGSGSEGGVVTSITGGFTKGQAYDFRIRSALYENSNRIKVSAWTGIITKTMAGPTGDVDYDCDVDLTDYTTYVNALHNPYAPSSLFERLIYFFNSLVANMGTRN